MQLDDPHQPAERHLTVAGSLSVVPSFSGHACLARSTVPSNPRFRQNGTPFLPRRHIFNLPNGLS